MDKRRITATDIFAAGLVLVMVINIFWFLNKKPLSENLDIENQNSKNYTSYIVTENKEYTIGSAKDKNIIIPTIKNITKNITNKIHTISKWNYIKCTLF